MKPWHARYPPDAAESSEDPVSTSFWIFVDLAYEQPAYFVAPRWWVRNDIWRATPHASLCTSRPTVTPGRADITESPLAGSSNGVIAGTSSASSDRMPRRGGGDPPVPTSAAPSRGQSHLAATTAHSASSKHILRAAIREREEGARSAQISWFCAHSTTRSRHLLSRRSGAICSRECSCRRTADACKADPGCMFIHDHPAPGTRAHAAVRVTPERT
jgi:hypothetical protein